MTDLPDWHWRVIVTLEDREGEQILGAAEPTRAAAKRDVHDRVHGAGGQITEWVETYVPRPSWDCPVCGVSEGMMGMPNLRGDHDWECMNCGSMAWGGPVEFDKVVRGSPGRIPPHRRTTREIQQTGGRRDRTTQTTLDDNR